MASKKGQFDVVEPIQFECSTCEWNDSKSLFCCVYSLFSLLPFFMNVRFDTWMKRANLCVRESLAEISSYSGPYGPHLLPRRIDGNHEESCCCCTKERCIEHLPLCCGESVSITHAAAPFQDPSLIQRPLPSAS